MQALPPKWHSWWRWRRSICRGKHSFRGSRCRVQLQVRRRRPQTQRQRRPQHRHHRHHRQHRHHQHLTASDSDSPNLTYAIVAGPAHGSLGTLNPTTGAVTYTPTANYNGTDSFTFTAFDGSLYSTGTVSLSVGTVTPTGYSSWITSTFANGTVSGGQQGPNDDFDKDGISNLIEYAIAGQDPTVPNATVGSFSGNVLSFSKRPDATGITYDIESSTLLTAGSWTSQAKPPVVESASAISFTCTPGTPVKNFFRLKVTQSP